MQHDTAATRFAGTLADIQAVLMDAEQISDASALTRIHDALTAQGVAMAIDCEVCLAEEYFTAANKIKEKINPGTF